MKLCPNFEFFIGSDKGLAVIALTTEVSFVDFFFYRFKTRLLKNSGQFVPLNLYGN